jgi:hypothetical protein
MTIIKDKIKLMSSRKITEVIDIGEPTRIWMPTVA